VSCTPGQVADLCSPPALSAHNRNRLWHLKTLMETASSNINSVLSGDDFDTDELTKRIGITPTENL
jgi:hypothetical protein